MFTHFRFHSIFGFNSIQLSCDTNVENRIYYIRVAALSSILLYRYPVRNLRFLVLFCSPFVWFSFFSQFFLLLCMLYVVCAVHVFTSNAYLMLCRQQKAKRLILSGNDRKIDRRFWYSKDMFRPKCFGIHTYTKHFIRF